MGAVAVGGDCSHCSFWGVNMEFLEKIFKPLILLATVVWVILAGFQLLSVEQLLVYVGVLSLRMGVRNLLILNISQKSGHMHEKIQFYIDRYGMRKGLIRYAVVLIGVYLVVGVVLIVVNLI